MIAEAAAIVFVQVEVCAVTGYSKSRIIGVPQNQIDAPFIIICEVH